MSDTLDTHAENNTATVVATVVVPTADLVLGMEDAPDPIPAGYPLTYTITVTNLGPATAVGTVLTNRLPPGVAFNAIATSQGTAGFTGTAAWAALGDLGTGGRATVTLILRPLVPGTVTNTATASAVTTDPLKGNNSASVKTIVLTQVAAQRNGGNILLSHPGLPGTVLERTTSLSPPVVWTPLMTNPPSPVSLPITNVNQYFRMRPPGL
jgi:uncharacterized repeat protein (TIGR01451 family)